MPPECANPLLLQWIHEWLQDARDHSTKAVSTYQKAYNSMQLCPIAFDHPSEAAMLNGVGDMICRRLTDKLTKHCQENGLPVPLMPHKKRKTQKATGDHVENGSEEEATLAPKRVKNKDYLPRIRSGAYAIVMALSEIGKNNKKGIPKSEVIELAEAHCDSSFTAVDPGHGQYYTAWKSIDILLKKDLVQEKRGAARTYGLTDEGWELVGKIKKGQQTLATSSKSKASSRRDDDEDDLEDDAQPVPRLHSQWLRDDDNFDSNFQAMQQLTGEDNREAVRSKPGSRKPPQSVRTNGDNDLDGERQPVSQGTRNPWVRDDDNFDANFQVMQDLIREDDRGTACSKPRARKASHYSKYDNGDSFHQIGLTPPRPRAAKVARTQDKAEQCTWPPPSPYADVVPIGKPSDIESIPRFDPIVLPPDSFTVHLVLDNREIQAKGNRDHIAIELIKLGVRPIKRNLELGDALWVAKLKDPNYLSKFGAEGDEIMLDHIVERKRLDDLISSIKDRRYDEQKFRLIKSGVKNVSYIIEEISLTQEHVSRYEESVESAIASMQVVNGFFVKKTLSIRETVKYLERMTKLLKCLYEEKTLRVIPTRDFTAHSYPRLQAHLRKKEAGTDYYITYQAFASLGSKSETLTLRDVFLKMLLCINGITPERALAIQQRWKTPYEFIKAYEELGDGKEGDKQKREFMQKQFGNAVITKKRIGKAASLKVAAVWGDVET